MEMAIETRGLTRAFGGRLAVDRLDLSVPARAVYGFLGRNGAGKTTTIRLLLGLIRADAGEIRLFGQPLARARARIGALVEVPALYDHLTGRENLDCTRRLLGLDRTEIDRVLGIVDLHAAAGRRVGGYSLGMRQRLGLARALLGRPRLLLLDEPTNGLDPDGIADMRRLLARLPQEEDVTLLVSSHLLDEVERVATHVGLVDRGRLVMEGPLDALRATGGEAVEVDTAPAAAATLARAGFRVDGEDGRLLVRGPGPCAPDRIAALLVKAGHPLHRLARTERRLEQLFADATRVGEAA